MDVWSQDRADHKNRIKRSNGTKGTANNAPEDIRELKGNLRFPLDFTYHGCPPSAHFPIVVHYLLLLAVHHPLKNSYGFLVAICYMDRIRGQFGVQ
jgi:hypothetical protein